MTKEKEGIQKQIVELVELKKGCQMKINEYDKIIKRLYTKLKTKK